MSLFNQLGEYGLNQVLARRLTTPGPAPSPTLEPALFPSVVLENDRPEYGWLKGERLAAAAGAVAAVAAQYSQAIINNPAGSNTIVTVESVYLNPAASQVGLFIVPPSYALAPGVPTVRDARWVQPGATAARPVCTFALGTSVGVPPEPPLHRAAPSLVDRYEQSVIVPPGWSFLIHCYTVNVALTSFSIAWRERSAQPGEV